MFLLVHATMAQTLSHSRPPAPTTSNNATKRNPHFAAAALCIVRLLNNASSSCTVYSISLALKQSSNWYLYRCMHTCNQIYTNVHPQSFESEGKGVISLAQRATADNTCSNQSCLARTIYLQRIHTIKIFYIFSPRILQRIFPAHFSNIPQIFVVEILCVQQNMPLDELCIFGARCRTKLS